MNTGLAPGIRVRKSGIDGKGCFAATMFCQDQQIAEYVGERIRAAEAEARRRAQGLKCICDIDSEWSIDGSRGGNGTHYINHSCEPNSYLVIKEGRIFLHALQEIVPGEEITADYLYELRLEQRVCRCGTATCLDRLNLGSMREFAPQISKHL